MRWVPLLMVLFVVLECAPRVPVPAAPTMSDEEDRAENVSPAAAPDDEVVEEESEEVRSSERDRLMLAKGFGIFNFSILTKDNCDFYYDYLAEQITDLKDDVEVAKDEVEEEQEDVDELLQAIENADASGDQEGKDELVEDLDEEEDDLQFAEEELEDREELLTKHQIIHKELKELCVELQAGKA